MTKFSPKYPKRAGKLLTLDVSVEEVVELFTNPKYLYDGQRDHDKNARKRKHTQGPLAGDSQRFAAAYCEETKQFVALDGYHRAHAVKAKNAWFEQGADIVLTVFRVATVDELNALYDQFNSAAAAKKAGCYFDSGVRAAKLRLTSLQILKGAKAYAVQLAAGLRGTLKVKEAVLKMKDGLKFLNGLKLGRERHECAGVLAAMIAVAQHCKDTRLVEQFVRNLNAVEYSPSNPTKAEKELMDLHAFVKDEQGGTGGAFNDTMFQACLAGFARFAFVSRGRRSMRVEELNLAQFLVAMEDFNSKLARV